MHTLGQDISYGLRSLIKNPGFSLVAVLTLALGVGANAAIFSVLRAVVLRDLPYHDADRVAVLWTKNVRQNLPDGSSYLNFRDWQTQSREFQAMAAYIRPEFTRATIGSGGDTARVHAGVVGPGFFELLGTTPLLGRTFHEADFTAAPRAIVISERLWRQRFAGDRAVIGRSVQMGDASMEIVGVMPFEFELPTPEVQVWQPLFFGPNWLEPRSRAFDSLVVLGRLAPSASFASARAEMDAIAAGLRQAYPAFNATLGVYTYELSERVIGSTTERSLWLLFGSVAFVLLIACANVANLVLARGASRINEFALRTTLGASQSRLIRQLLTENVALSLVAAVVALLFAWVATAVLRSIAPGALPRAEGIHVDGSVLLFLLAASLASGLCAALLPALQLSAAGPAQTLREGGPRSLGGRGRRRAHHGLVVAETALAVVLLSGAGLLIHSFLRVQAADRGFDSSNVLLLQVDLPARYNSRERSAAFFTEALAKIRALPGVVAAGAISDFFIHRQPDYRVAREGQPPSRPEDPAPPLTEDQVIPGYFEAMRIPLLRGRLLTDNDLAPDAPSVVVINEEMARRFWPGEDALGKRFKYGFDTNAKSPWKTVVGVVADMRRQRLDEAAIPFMFQPAIINQMDLVVRTDGDPDQLRNAIRAAVQSVDPAAPPYGVIAVEERLRRSVALRELQTMLLMTLAGVALCLAVIGAYGIMHQSVTARTQEIGVRVALGASASSVARMVLIGGLAPAGFGLLLGLLGSMALSQTIATFLYETNPLDPLTYLGVSALLLTVTAIACLGPARRASRCDPMVALRDQ